MSEEGWEIVNRPVSDTPNQLTKKMINEGWMDDPDDNTRREAVVTGDPIEPNYIKKNCDTCLSHSCGMIEGETSLLIHSKNYEQLIECMESCSICAIQNGNYLFKDGKKMAVERLERLYTNFYNLDPGYVFRYRYLASLKIQKLEEMSKKLDEDTKKLMEDPESNPDVMREMSVKVGENKVKIEMLKGYIDGHNFISWLICRADEPRLEIPKDLTGQNRLDAALRIVDKDGDNILTHDGNYYRLTDKTIRTHYMREETGGGQDQRDWHTLWNEAVTSIDPSSIPDYGGWIDPENCIPPRDEPDILTPHFDGDFDPHVYPEFYDPEFYEEYDDPDIRMMFKNTTNMPPLPGDINI